MDFNNIQEVIRYVEGISQDGLVSLKDDFKETMNNEIEKQIYNDHKPEVYERTDQLKDTPEVIVGDKYLSAGFVDNGDWESWASHSHFFPMIAWEEWGSVKRSTNQGGGTYPLTHITEGAYQKLDKEIPVKFKQYLISRGLKVE